jgi:hypothetical protein
MKYTLKQIVKKDLQPNFSHGDCSGDLFHKPAEGTVKIFTNGKPSTGVVPESETVITVSEDTEPEAILDYLGKSAPGLNFMNIYIEDSKYGIVEKYRAIYKEYLGDRINEEERIELIYYR